MQSSTMRMRPRKLKDVSHLAVQFTSCSDLWRRISIYVCIPALLIAGVNAYNLYAAHQAHVAHEKTEHGDDDEETPEYPYQNIRVCN